MDLWQLKIFCRVVELRSFSKAAKAVHLSQPTVSSHIKDLEAHFGCPLIDRLSKGAAPTHAGRLIYGYALRLLALREEAETAMAQFQGKTLGRMVLGGSTIPGGYLLPRMIGLFKKRFPQVTLSLVVSDTEGIIAGVLEGSLEFGVVGAESRDRNIRQETLVSDEMRLVDLQISKTDNRDSAVPGLTQLSYTIVVTNDGPSGVSGAWVTDQLPDALQNVAYTSVTSGYVTGNTASGAGNIDDLVSMAPGASITYTVTAGISPWASGTLANTAQVAAPQGVVDTNPNNNAATDRTQLTPQVDLQISKTDNRDSAVPGLTQLSYTIVVTNNGPSGVSGAWVTDQLPDA